MTRLIQFEWKKMIRTKFYVLFLLLSVLFVGGIFVRNFLLQEEIVNKKIEKFSDYRKDVLSQVTTDQKMMEDFPSPELEEKIEAGLLVYRALNQLIESIEGGKWEEELQYEIQVYELAMDYKEKQGQFKLSEKDMQKEIQLNEELLKRGLAKEDLDLSINPPIFLKKIVTFFFNTFGFLILLFLLTTYITREFEEHSIQIAFTLPVSRSRYIISKFLSLFSAGFIWWIAIFGVSYLLTTLFGTSQENSTVYPLFTQSGDFLDVGDYLWQAVGYSILFLAFAISILVFIGFLLRNTIVTSLLVFVLLIGNHLVLREEITALFNPFSYQQIDSLILKEPTYYPMGLVVIFCATVITLIFTILLNKRRGI